MLDFCVARFHLCQLRRTGDGGLEVIRFAGSKLNTVRERTFACGHRGLHHAGSIAGSHRDMFGCLTPC